MDAADQSPPECASTAMCVLRHVSCAAVARAAVLGLPAAIVRFNDDWERGLQILDRDFYAALAQMGLVAPLLSACASATDSEATGQLLLWLSKSALSSPIVLRSFIRQGGVAALAQIASRHRHGASHVAVLGAYQFSCALKKFLSQTANMKSVVQSTLRLVACLSGNLYLLHRGDAETALHVAVDAILSLVASLQPIVRNSDIAAALGTENAVTIVTAAIDVLHHPSSSRYASHAAELIQSLSTLPGFETYLDDSWLDILPALLNRTSYFPGAALATLATLVEQGRGRTWICRDEQHVRRLVALLPTTSYGPSHLVQPSCQLIKHISAQDDAREWLLSNGCVGLLCSSLELSLPCAANKIAVCSTLLHLSHAHEDYLFALLRNDALVSTLFSWCEENTDDTVLMQLVQQLLKQLAKYPDRRTEFTTLTRLSCLRDMFRHYAENSEYDALCDLCYLIITLAEDVMICDSPIAGIASALFDLVDEGGRSDVVNAACNALIRLASNHSERALINEGYDTLNVFNVLNQQLENQLVVKMACTVLFHATAYSCDVRAAAGGVDGAAHLLIAVLQRYQHDADIVDPLVGIVGNIANGDPSFCRGCAHAGSIPLLVGAVRQHAASSDIISLACNTLSITACQSDVYCATMISEGILPNLVIAHDAWSADSKVAACVCSLLKHLVVADAENAAIFVQAGYIPRLIRLLYCYVSNKTSALHSLCATLASLARNPEFRAQFLAAGVIPLVICAFTQNIADADLALSGCALLAALTQGLEGAVALSAIPHAASLLASVQQKHKGNLALVHLLDCLIRAAAQ